MKALGCAGLGEEADGKGGEEADGQEREKEQLKDEEQDSPCQDWMVVSVNCHYAKDRSTFTNYRKVGKSAQNFAALAAMVYVAGVGTVELKVQALLDKGSPIRTLVLKNILVRIL